MDATFRPLKFSKENYAYAQNKKISEIFQNMLQNLVVNRPNKPIDFLYDLLMKRGVFDVPRVYVLGPATLDRKLVCSAIANKLKLIHLTRSSLERDYVSKHGFPDVNDIFIHRVWGPSHSEYVDLLKNRVEMPDCMQNGWLVEAFPMTRLQAFALRKAGVFPTHIVIIDNPSYILQVSRRKSSKISFTGRARSENDILYYLGQMNMILNFHANSYVRRFEVGHSTQMNETITAIIDFVRSRPIPFMSYLPRILLFGPYGSGRKTMARKLSAKFQLVQVNYHEELRKAALKDSPLREKFEEIMKTSNPVPDELLVKVASNRLLGDDCRKNGWIMINFPDTRTQLEMLAKELEGFQINRAIFLEASYQTCLSRVELRRWDPLTGQVCCIPPPTLGIAPVNRLIQRPQDNAESVSADHRLYSKNIGDIKLFLRHQLSEDIVTEVDASGSLDSVFEGVQGALLMSSKIKLPEEKHCEFCG